MVLRWIAWRFMLKGTERGTFSAMTLFAWLAIGVGAGAMSSLLSVMYGFEGALKEKVLNAYPHVLVQAAAGSGPINQNSELEKKLIEEPFVQKVMPFIQNEMILKGPSRSLGAVVWGIPLSALSHLKFKIQEGVWPTLEDPSLSVALGSELAQRLGIFVADKVNLISPVARSGALGLLPQSQTFLVSGVFASGHYEFDEQYLLLPLEDAQDFLGMPQQITGWQVWVEPLEKSSEVAKNIQKVLPAGLEAKSWESFNSALFQSLKLEQYSMFLILSFAILIAVMNIVITLTMNVAHKKKNIGILRSFGATTLDIRRIFLWQGGLMGGVGLALGATLTFLFVVYVKYFSAYQLPEIYYDRTIPVELRPFSFLVIYSVATLLIYLATLYPASQASKLSVIEAVRE